jgi:hypothetical protein
MTKDHFALCIGESVYVAAAAAFGGKTDLGRINFMGVAVRGEACGHWQVLGRLDFEYAGEKLWFRAPRPGQADFATEEAAGAGLRRMHDVMKEDLIRKGMLTRGSRKSLRRHNGFRWVRERGTWALTKALNSIPGIQLEFTDQHGRPCLPPTTDLL